MGLKTEGVGKKTMKEGRRKEERRVREDWIMMKEGCGGGKEGVEGRW